MPCAWYGGTFLPELIRGVPETPKAIQVFVIVLGCPPGLGGKTPLLKSLQTLVTGYGEI